MRSCSANRTGANQRSHLLSRQASLGPRIRLNNHPTVRMIDRNSPSLGSVTSRTAVGANFVIKQV